MLRTALLALVSLSLAACGSGHEGTVTFTLSAAEGDVNNGTLVEDTHIKTDNATWQAFLAAARSELGAAPTEIDIDQVRIQLDAGRSKNVAKLEDALRGEGALFIRSESGGAQVDIATFEDPKGSAQVEVDLTGNELKTVNAALLGSDFRLGLRSPTPLTRESDFDAEIIVTLDVIAR